MTATCCASCVAQELEHDCNACEEQSTHQPPEPQFLYQLILEGSPVDTVTTSARAMEILLVELTSNGRAWRAVRL